MLTLEKLREIRVLENNEPLMEIKEGGRLKLLHEHKYLSPYLRRRVGEMLIDAADNLPEGYKLLVVTAYRPIAMQRELWNQRVWQMVKKHPFQFIFSPNKFKRLVGKYTAPPGGSAHQCGAAVDVTILNREGERLDMGTSLTDFGSKCHTDSPLITEGQKANRKTLLDTMTKAGFVNYPLEWWHYSYGDRHWALDKGLPECFYGPLEI